MTALGWTEVIVASVVVTHLLVCWYLVRRIGADRERTLASGGTSVTPADGDDAPDGLVCPTCGTENDPEYRFCGNCTAELPTARAATTDRTTPRQRGML